MTRKTTIFAKEKGNADLTKHKPKLSTHTQMFTAALFTIAKKWKQLKCPSTEISADSRLMVSRDLGKRRMGNDYYGVQDFFLGVMKMFWN